MKHIFIVNPMAGKGKAVETMVPKIEAALARSGAEGEIYITKLRGDATRFVKERAATGEELRFYACGGDGTINEVVSGTIGFEKVQVAFIPCGTGNDFLKNFGRTEADFLDLDAQLAGVPKRVDIIQVDGKNTCVNLGSAGLDAGVALHMAKFKRLPLVRGSVAYTMSIAYNMLGKLGIPMRFVMDGEAFSIDDCLLCAVGNGMYYGGDYKGLPDAKVDDGVLDVVIIRKVSRLRVPGLLGIYRRGEHGTSEKVQGIIKLYRCKEISIESDRSFAVNIDGECHETKRITMAVVPSAITVSLPLKPGQIAPETEKIPCTM